MGLIPDADSLVLVRQVHPSPVGVVVGSHGGRGGAKEVLGAPLRCQVGKVARELRDLQSETTYQNWALLYCGEVCLMHVTDLDRKLSIG